MRPTSRFSGGFDDRCPSIPALWLAPLILVVGQKYYKMPFSKGFRRTIVGIILFILIGMIYGIWLPFSNGQKWQINRIVAAFLNGESMESKYGSDYGEQLVGGEMIRYVSQDSHNIYGGGNLVIQYRGKYWWYMGHLCGNGFMNRQIRYFDKQSIAKDGELENGFIGYLQNHCVKVIEYK